MKTKINKIPHLHFIANNINNNYISKLQLTTGINSGSSQNQRMYNNDSQYHGSTGVQCVSGMHVVGNGREPRLRCKVRQLIVRLIVDSATILMHDTACHGGCLVSR